MKTQVKHKSLMARLQAYYQKAERDAAGAVPFYVTDDGALFSNPKEVIRSKSVQHQLRAFASLRSEARSELDTSSHESPSAAQAS
jgi:hypothetical protein